MLFLKCVYIVKMLYFLHILLFMYTIILIYIPIICFNILYYDLNNPQIEILCLYIIS